MVSCEVSVVMPVYNARRYLSLAINSILQQTFSGFEFIIVNDGSSDESLKILEKYAKKDKRISIINQPNQGIAGALNNGIKASKAKYIARMDADDISLPQRLELQFKYMEKHPDCAIVGSWVYFIDISGAILKIYRPPCTHEEILIELQKGNGGAIIHPAAMFRKKTLLQVGGYLREYNYIEDYDVYTRIADKGRLANLSDILFKYRLTPTGINYSEGTKQRRGMINELKNQFCLKRGVPPINHIEPLDASNMTQSAMHRQWAYFACEDEHWNVALKHALLSLIREPRGAESWKCFNYVLKKKLGLK
ncbi:MAG: glycosyltransferase [Candidatus Omnitrophota bacterium]